MYTNSFKHFNLYRYCIEGNFRGRKLSRILRFLGLSVKIEGHTHMLVVAPNNPRKFSPQISYFHQFAKVFSLVSFPLYGSHPICMTKQIQIHVDHTCMSKVTKLCMTTTAKVPRQGLLCNGWKVRLQNFEWTFYPSRNEYSGNPSCPHMASTPFHPQY